MKLPTCFLFSLGFSQVVFALDWDTNTATSGAQGAVVSPSTWNASNLFWWNSAFNVGWTSSSLAVFGGTAGVVQLGSELDAWGLEFTTGNFTPPASSFGGAYEIKGATTNGQRLILSLNAGLGGNPQITVNSGLRAIISTTHPNTGLAGGVRVFKRGAGTLILQQNTTVASSPLVGSFTVEAGKLMFDSNVSTTLAGLNPFPGLDGQQIIAQDGASIQLDRSHVLGGDPSSGTKRIRLEGGSLMHFANARQYLAELDLAGGSVITASRETTSAGTDEGDSSAALTPTGGLLIKSGASPSIVKSMEPGVEVREGALSYDISDGAVSPDLVQTGAITSPAGSTQTITKSGAGTLRLDATNTFQGDLVVNAGLVSCNASNALGAATSGGNGEVRITAGGAVDLSGRANTVNKSFFIAGNGPTGAGALVNTGINLNENSRVVNLTLTADASIGGNGNLHIGKNPIIMGTGSINGGGHLLTKIGSGELRVRAASTNINWKVTSGILSADVESPFGSNAVEVGGGATVRGVGNVWIPNELLCGGPATIGAEGGTTSYTGGVSLGVSDLTMDVANGATLLFSGDVTGQKGGPGMIQKNGLGTAVINGQLPITHLNAGILRGTGKVTGSFTTATGTTLAPGNPTGTFEADVVSLAGKLSFAVNGANSAKLKTSSISLNPTATLEYAAGNTYTEPLYILAEYVNLNGTFASVPSPPAGYTLDMNLGGAGKIALVSTTLTPFQSWALSNGLVGNDGLPDADPDGDGLSNTLEFILATEPNPANPGSDSRSQMPVMAPFSPSQMALSYRRSPVAGYANPVVQYGNDLTDIASWQTAVHGQNGIFITETTNFYGPNISRIQVVFPLPGNPKRFARLSGQVP